VNKVRNPFFSRHLRLNRTQVIRERSCFYA